MSKFHFQWTLLPHLLSFKHLHNIFHSFEVLEIGNCSSKSHMMQPVRPVHAEHEANRLLSSTRLDSNVSPRASIGYDSIPSPYSKSFDFKMVISNRTRFRWCSYISALLLLLIIAVSFLLHFLPHKHNHHEASNNHTVAMNQALKFFDAQKCKNLS